MPSGSLLLLTTLTEGDYGRQLIFYSLLVPNAKPTLIFLIPDKSGGCPEESVEVNKDGVDKLKTEIDQLLLVIDSGELLNLGCGERDCAYCQMKKLL